MGKNKGFTLIEFIVVFGIVSILTGLTLAVYNTFADDQKLNNEAERLVNVLTLAQKKGIVGDELSINPACPQAPTPTPNFAGYRVSFDTNNTFSLLRECASNTVTPVPVQQYQLPPSEPMIFLLPAPGSYITFMSLSRGIIATGGTTIRIKHTGRNRCIDVTVSPVGNARKGNTVSC